VLGDAAALGLADHALRKTFATWEHLQECLSTHAASGRPGTARFRQLLERRRHGAPAETNFAREVEERLISAGLPPPAREWWIHVWGTWYRLDLTWPALQLGVECDGRDGHEHARAFEEDPVRRNRLELAEWLVLHKTWRRHIDQPDDLIREVHEALARRSEHA
jgi:hypothetical protein